MRDLNYELKQLCLRNRDGSYATQHAREAILAQIANQLHALGFKDMKAASLKPKHVTALVEHWKAASLSPGTIKNRMTELRWWAEKVDKQNVMARDNASYGIPQRQYVTNVSQSRCLTSGDLARITDPYTRLSPEAAGRLRAATRGVDQNPAGMGRWRGPAHPQGELGQGWAPAGYSDPQRAPAAGAE